MDVGELNINVRPSGEINGGHGPALGMAPDITVNWIGGA